MTSEKSIKKHIAHIITGNEFNQINSYEQELEYIYNNQYVTVLKVPTTMFILGACARFKKQNIALKLLKQVVVEALELSGVELTFTNESWDKLKIIPSTVKYCGNKWDLFSDSERIENKYMSEFFEL